MSLIIFSGIFLVGCLLLLVGTMIALDHLDDEPPYCTRDVIGCFMVVIGALLAAMPPVAWLVRMVLP